MALSGWQAGMASAEVYREDSRPGDAAVDSAPILLATPVGQFTSPPIAFWSACVEWATLCLVLLLIFRFSGLLSRVSGLPTITLYLLTGAGCFQAGAVKHGTVAQLLPFHHATLAVITLAAGSELAMEQLRTHARTIRCLTVTLTVAAVIIVFWLSLLVITQSQALGVDAGMPVTGIASMFAAVIAIARSPSSAIAIVSEQRADGPFTQTVLSVTMVTDVVVIVLFTASLELAQASEAHDLAPETCNECGCSALACLLRQRRRRAVLGLWRTLRLLTTPPHICRRSYSARRARGWVGCCFGSQAAPPPPSSSRLGTARCSPRSACSRCAWRPRPSCFGPRRCSRWVAMPLEPRRCSTGRPKGARWRITCRWSASCRGVQSVRFRL